MSAKIIDGKALAKKVRAEVKELISWFGKTIGLAVVVVGNNSASEVYVRNKVKACEEVGIVSTVIKMAEESTQKEVERQVRLLAESKDVNGIIVQLPLPKHLDADMICRHIPPEKDVDGFSAYHMGALALNKEWIVPCTPVGIMRMLHEYNISLEGKKVVVVGRSNIVGKPMAMLALNENATVTVCHSKTKDIKQECMQADILISAVGKPKFITWDMVKPGAVVIDVGMNRDKDGKLCGDVDFDLVSEVASYITPVPGGVGPMTVAMLLYNVAHVAIERK